MSTEYGIEPDIYDGSDRFDPEVAKEAAKKLLIPDGWYETEVPFGIKTIKKDGRRFVNAFGALLKDGEQVGRLGYRFSPDLVEKEGKPDWWYQQFLKIKDVYQATMGEPHKTTDDLTEFLENHPIMLKVSIGIDKRSDSPANNIWAFGKVRG